MNHVKIFLSAFLSLILSVGNIAKAIEVATPNAMVVPPGNSVTFSVIREKVNHLGYLSPNEKSGAEQFARLALISEATVSPKATEFYKYNYGKLFGIDPVLFSIIRFKANNLEDFTPNEKTVIRAEQFARLAEHVYPDSIQYDTTKWLEKAGINHFKDTWTVPSISAEILFTDKIWTSLPQSFSYNLYVDSGNTWVLAFAGTDSIFDAIIGGTVSDAQFLKALEVADHIMNSLPDGYDLIVTGHSLGGGLAQTVAYYYGLEAYTFNSIDPMDKKDYDKHKPRNKAKHMIKKDDRIFNIRAIKDIIAAGKGNFGRDILIIDNTANHSIGSIKDLYDEYVRGSEYGLAGVLKDRILKEDPITDYKIAELAALENIQDEEIRSSRLTTLIDKIKALEDVVTFAKQVNKRSYLTDQEVDDFIRRFDNVNRNARQYKQDYKKYISSNKDVQAAFTRFDNELNDREARTTNRIIKKVMQLSQILTDATDPMKKKRVTKALNESLINAKEFLTDEEYESLIIDAEVQQALNIVQPVNQAKISSPRTNNNQLNRTVDNVTNNVTTNATALGNGAGSYNITRTSSISSSGSEDDETSGSNDILVNTWSTISTDQNRLAFRDIRNNPTYYVSLADIISSDDPNRPSARNIYFDSGEWVIKSKYREIILNHGTYLKDNLDLNLILSGHCDCKDNYNTGPAKYLSTNRVNSVRNVFVDVVGIDGDRISNHQFGSTKEIVVNSNYEEPLNRRVEIVYDDEIQSQSSPPLQARSN